MLDKSSAAIEFDEELVDAIAGFTRVNLCNQMLAKPTVKQMSLTHLQYLQQARICQYLFAEIIFVIVPHRG